MNKVMKLKKYDVDKMYVADTAKERILVYEDHEDKYIKLSLKTVGYEQPAFTFYKRNEIRIISSLKDFVLKNDLSALMLDRNGHECKELSEQDAIVIFRILIKKSKLSPSQMLQINRISYKVTSIVCDLLGLNVTCNPNSGYNFDKSINETIVPAWRLLVFKRNMIDFIKAKLIYDGSVCISNYKDGMDYKISRSLSKAKIKVTEQMKKNAFSLVANKNGNVTIDGIELGTNSVKQKIFKF